ncbi:MAG TPA: GNAT family N-acetyltransferase [bacterium]|nr:GNAT family N-acetyltransferase [bacterium]HPS31514.1 GNAT family N-acetyltransferase [bacterium]
MNNEITVRKVNGSDMGSVAEIAVTTWRDAYKGIMTDEYLYRHGVEDRKASFQTFFMEMAQENSSFFVAEKDGTVIGFAMCGKARDDLEPFKGEVYALYVHPHFQKSGAGTQLFNEVGNYLNSNGFYPSMLWVLKDNHTAGRFYEKLGGIPVAEKTEKFGETELIEIAYGFKNLT